MKTNNLISGKTAALILLAQVFLFLILLILPGCSTQNPGDTLVEGTRLSDEADAENADSAEESAGETLPDLTVETENQDVSQSESDTAAVDTISDNINLFSGLELTDQVLDSRPIAIMVQNNPKARPHSGLIYADIVFELVAEGGITRFIAVFSTFDADIIGPVRSGRIYFAEIARSLDPVYTFWGTYPEAYEAIKNMDMDALDANSTAYINYTSAGWRDPSRSDALEHTAFIDTYGIKEDAEKYGYSLKGGQSPMVFKIDAPEGQRGSISEIAVDFSSETFLAGFSYDMGTNKYLKFLAGQPHSDFETGKQISLSNVIVLITDIDGPIDSSGHMLVRSTGSHEQNKAYYFMDGNVIEGSWARGSIYDPFEFKDSSSNRVLFNRGSTWVCIIGSEDRLSY
ncbi:MAG: DUF3048 domain-containing protein [Actinobacteria bacterium]|nr:DUF3048 domain-containing protein [Actinomycetota bacterium]